MDEKKSIKQCWRQNIGLKTRIALIKKVCNTHENFQLQTDKNERKLAKHGLQNDKIDLLNCFQLLISKNSFKMGKKA